MPRRKGHGIPPTKRVKPEAISRSAPLKNKLYNDIPPISVKEEPIQIQMTVNTVPIKSEPPSIISDALHSKYLHKKFKKMASTLLPEESNNQINNVLNGSRGKRVPEMITSSDSEKVPSPPAGSPKYEVPVSNSRVISPPAGRYVCSYCKLACAKPSVLQKHIRAHTNERPYPCLPCGFAFKTKSNLYKHCRSRAHACKVEESGEKMPIICDGEEGITSEEDDSSNISNAASVNSRIDTDPESKEEMPKSIYKPKYRFMEQPLKSPNSCEKFDEKKENTGMPPQLHLKIPIPNTAVTVSTPSPFTSSSSPSPEFLHRHISKLISENQAIVETNDPFWTKKYLQRSNSNDNNSTPSPLSLSPSSSDMNMKKSVKHPGVLETAEEIGCDKPAQKQSKLALALLRPQSAISPKYSNLSTAGGCDAQPLNLTTNNKDQNNSLQRTQDQISRKRSYSEGIPEKPPTPLRERMNAIPLKLNNHAISDFQRYVSNMSETSDGMLLNHLEIKKELVGNPQNPEGSIIKDLLLKARAGGSAVNSSISQVLGTPVVDATSISKPVLSLTPPVSDDRAYSPSSQFMCHLCKDPIAYRSAEHLEIHQLYHCKGNDASSRSSHNSPSPLGDTHRLNSPSFRKNKEGPPMLITPSHPSPGPLLGSTPLVDSYRTKSPLTTETSPTLLKKRRFDTGTVESRVISATTLRSLEELSKCPMRSNLQMFGGEVKILDSPGGEAKTLRIEPTNRGSTKPSDIPLQISSHLGKNLIKEENDLQDNNMVVTIAKKGLHSGGSIVQVPNKSGTVEQHSPRQAPTSRSVISGSPAPHLQGYQENKMLIPIVPKGVTPPVQLPYIPFTSILPESTVINPLTNITAYNPLTLPPANLLPPTSPSLGVPSQYSSGIVTILHGGKEIPYVPGMPGPHSLLPNHHVPVYTSKMESDSKFAKVSEAKSNIQQEQFSRSTRNDKPQTVSNKPSSLNIPTIQVNSETMDSPGDQSSATNLRKRSFDESQPPASTAPKRSQMSTQSSEADEKEKGDSTLEKKFLRPTTLPLKPGTFVPKRQQLGTPVLSLVSPETPRPRKSYGQLYLNGHAYTYLGLKCSTRMFFCTLNKPQPIYVPLSPEHNKVSMYSNWKVCSDADPNPFGLDPGQVMGLYDSRHRPATYTLARSRVCEAVTHSSYWTSSQRSCHQSDKEDSSEAAPKRVKIFAGGFESNEDYIYVRGRGRGRYVCEECGIRCKKPSMLKKHIRTHTDVRPFTCIHCKFSFKTKGNLTKHMKSKAHYKKCVDLGITPVPTVVDDSYVDEVALARQQALREKQGVNPDESEEEEEDEDEDETDDDNDEDEDEGDGEGEECVEREAARSLLTLSESLQSVAQRQHVSAGLIPVGGRPFTYPYSYSQVTEPSHLPVTQPQTPTLTAISAQREREKVSQNTGLAREVQVKGSVEEHQGNVEDALKGVAARHYFPSSRDLGDSDREPVVSKQSTPIDLSSKPTEKSTRVCEAAMLLASLCSTMERLPLTTTTAPVSEDSTLLQAYLTERAVQDSRMKQHQYKHKPTTIELPSTTPAKTNISVAKENALGILAQTSSDARKMPLSEPVVTSASPNKPQAEFFPPSSGPSPSYVSILEDGRSMCNICNKVFSKPSQLRLHVNIHYFERPFRCESCAVSFRTKGHLQKHQRSVSHLNKVSMNSTFGTATTANPRPFKCDDCKIAFRIHGHLAKHLRSKMHIMKLECLGKLPFGTYAEMERSGVNMNDIDTTDCDNSLESLQLLAQKLYEKDPSKLGQWDPNEMMPQHAMSSGDTSSEGEEDPSPQHLPSPLVQRLAPPPLQRATLSTPQEPLKCVINIRNSSVNFNLKGPRHKGPSEMSEESSTDNVDSVSNTRTDDSGQS